MSQWNGQPGDLTHALNNPFGLLVFSPHRLYPTSLKQRVGELRSKNYREEGTANTQTTGKDIIRIRAFGSPQPGPIIKRYLRQYSIFGAHIFYGNLHLICDNQMKDMPLKMKLQ